jgi:tight adherence protein B
MSQALRAGQSLPSGIQLVGAQVDQPLGPEFNLAFEQQNLGMTLNDSLRAMSERVPNLDLRFFVTAVVLQRQTGGDLAEVLDKISSLTRERFKIRGQIQALTGEGRISGVVLLAMPPVLFFVMMKLNYEYVMMLFEEPLGQKMLLGGLILQFIGAFSIKKIIDIKV